MLDSTEGLGTLDGQDTFDRALVPLRTCLINTAKSKPINAIINNITLLARISTTLEAALDNQEITLPINPGIDTAALPAKVLRYEATFLRAALTLSTNPLPGEGLGEGVGVGGVMMLVILVTANTIVLITNPIAVVIKAIVIPSFLNNSLNLSPEIFHK